MDAPSIIQALQRLVPDARAEAAPSIDQPIVYVDREHLPDVATALRDAPELLFTFLADVTAVDLHPREPYFEVVYILACLGVPGFSSPDSRTGKRCRMKVRVPRDDAHLPTVSMIWPAAGWAEREVWDLFGIVFDGHQDLRRILMPDDWEGHPLRKDYPVQVKVAVQTYEPIQISEAEFVANIRGARAVERTGQSAYSTEQHSVRIAEPPTRPPDGTSYERKADE